MTEYEWISQSAGKTVKVQHKIMGKLPSFNLFIMNVISSTSQDFTGGPVVKTPCCLLPVVETSAEGGVGSTPGQGTKIPHAVLWGQ